MRYSRSRIRGTLNERSRRKRNGQIRNNNSLKLSIMPDNNGLSDIIIWTKKMAAARAAFGHQGLAIISYSQLNTLVILLLLFRPFNFAKLPWRFSMRIRPEPNFALSGLDFQICQILIRGIFLIVPSQAISNKLFAQVPSIDINSGNSAAIPVLGYRLDMYLFLKYHFRCELFGLFTDA